MNELPGDVVKILLNRSDPKTFCELRITCKRFYQVSRSLINLKIGEYFLMPRDVVYAQIKWGNHRPQKRKYYLLYDSLCQN